MGKFVNIEFGNPKKRDCEGMGICNVELADASKSINACCRACFSLAFLAYSPEMEEVQLLLNRKDVSYRAYKKQFSDGLFRVETDFVFSLDLIRAFGLPEGAAVKQGAYPVQEIEGKLCLSFPIATTKELSLQIIHNRRFAATA